MLRRIGYLLLVVAIIVTILLAWSALEYALFEPSTAELDLALTQVP